MQSKWHRELDIFSQIKPGIILEGNIADVFYFPEAGELEGALLPLVQYLHYFYKHRGYSVVVRYDMTQGFTCPDSTHDLEEYAKVINTKTTVSDGVPHIPCGLTTANANAPDYIARAVRQANTPVVILMDMASRYIVSPDRMGLSEVHALSRLQKGIADAAQPRTPSGKTLRNLVVLITGKQNDLPAWFFLDNPTVKTLHIGNPSTEERRAMLEGGNLRTFFATEVYREQRGQLQSDDASKLIDRFVARTEGFTNYEMNNLRTLCRNQAIDVARLCSVIDLYTYGIRDNPWQSEGLIAKLQNAQERFSERVKGQDSALRQTIDVVKRSVVGMSGAQHSSDSKPKGVLFFAGPTGTGKTETAKTLAELIFGDEKACIRFDMSEYSQSHSDQRLLGAPPGYVGYEAGGQLTNAILRNPFSILLFDEIEKAAPSIMDKFLQILEDGRMTDGQGHTVYFSECIIIFTSNLGITIDDGINGRVENVTPDMPYDKVRQRVRDGIEDYFKLRLGRPEILNRIGENIVVFDYIREDVAAEILRSRLRKLQALLQTEKNVELTWTAEAEDTLLSVAKENLVNGGRGIMNVVEYAWINPLSRAMFDRQILNNAKIHITSVNRNVTPVEIECEVCSI